jgi:peptidoglycan hydrolase CwlO-like protein
MAENNGKWQLAFWIVTGFSVLIFTASVTGYFKLDTKIAYAEEKLRKEKNENIKDLKKDIEKVDNKVERLEAKIDALKTAQSQQATTILLEIQKLKK